MDDDLDRMFAASRPPGLVLKDFPPDNADPRAGAIAAFVHKSIATYAHEVLAPAFADHVKKLRAGNIALERRIAELEQRLDVDGRLREVERRLDALQPGASIKRIA
jgi:hypothetical protein